MFDSSTLRHGRRSRGGPDTRLLSGKRLAAFWFDSSAFRLCAFTLGIRDRAGQRFSVRPVPEPYFGDFQAWMAG